MSRTLEVKDNGWLAFEHASVLARWRWRWLAFWQVETFVVYYPDTDKWSTYMTCERATALADIFGGVVRLPTRRVRR